MHTYIQGIEGLTLWGVGGEGGFRDILSVHDQFFIRQCTMNKLGCMHGQQRAEEA